MMIAYPFPQLQDSIQSAKRADSAISLPATNKDTLVAVKSMEDKPISKKPVAIKPESGQIAVEPKTSTAKPNLQWNTSGNFFVQNGLTGIVTGLSEKTTRKSPQVISVTEKPTSILPNIRNKDTFDWLLGIFLFLVILFVWIRVFYSKFFGTLANALASYHLSVKMFEEKNVFLQRVSIVLDFIYIVVFSVFIFQILQYNGYSARGMNGMQLFLLLFNILMIYTLLRVFVLRITGSLFLARTLISEYIHHTFVINKGMGIVLFPVIIMGQYMPYKLIPVLLGAGLLVLSAGFIMKSMRSYQIIIRRDILLFYLILYLCTLEILPLLLGYKFVTALIQNI